MENSRSLPHARATCIASRHSRARPNGCQRTSERWRKKAEVASKKCWRLDARSATGISTRETGMAARLAPLVPDTDTHTLPPLLPPDPADEAMCARARERYTADRKSARRRRRKPHAAMPTLIIVGGLKCGTTSIHHYLGLHPEIQMSKPKELNFFVTELNWDLGLDWYASRFDDRFKVRGESSPHYTNLPRYEGVAERIKAHCPDAKLLYMVRDPIKRILSHWMHATGAGYETRDMATVLADPDTQYVNRSRYWMQLQPYLEHFDRSQIEVIAQEELQADRDGTMRKAFAYAGVDESFTSEQFDR